MDTYILGTLYLPGLFLNEIPLFLDILKSLRIMSAIYNIPFNNPNYTYKTT